MPRQPDEHQARYEYRVWGKNRRARRLLAELADEVTAETVQDCYFLDGATDANVKIRAGALKVKRLVGTTRGFDRWIASRYRAGHDIPKAFVDLAAALRLHKAHRETYDLVAQVERLDDEHPTPVFVTKRRVRYRIGSLRAEDTELTIDATGEVLRTVAIEGDDIDALVALRKRLGLKGKDNIAVHEAIDAER